MVIDTNKFQFIELIFFVGNFFVENFQKCSTLYFQKKAVCFAKQKVKDSKILLSFYNV